MQSVTLPIAEIGDLKSLYASNHKGVVLVKPKVVFKRIEDLFGEPVAINLHVPSSGIGSLTMLEAAIMSSLLKIIAPANVFEFGTFLGFSTAILLRNTPESSMVYSIDLDTDASDLAHAKDYSDQELRADHVRNDDYLRYVQAQKGPYYLSALDAPTKKRLKLLKGNSMAFDCKNESICGKIDFVFVDGGHEYDIIKSDTQKSRDLIGGDGLILWHDYNSKIHFEVTTYVKEIAPENLIIHIENTMFAFCLSGDAKAKFLG